MISAGSTPLGRLGVYSVPCAGSYERYGVNPVDPVDQDVGARPISLIMVRDRDQSG